MKLKIYLIFFLLIPLTTVSQGLYFYGNDKLIEERTSYLVFKNKNIHFKKQFSIGFDIAIRRFDNFGYIFRLEDQHTNQTYNFTYAYKNKKNSFFKFNAEGKDNLISIELDNSSLGNRRWINILFNFDLDTQSLTIQMDGQTYRVENLSLPHDLYPVLTFGKNSFSAEVPSFSIKDLTVNGERQHFTFPLNESDGEEVHDSKGKVTGTVHNPNWLINAGYYWKPICMYESESVSGVNFDEISQSILFFNKDSLVSFNLLTGETHSESYKNDLPVDIQLGMSFIDKQKRKLYVYEVNNLPIDDPTVASLDLENFSWDTVGIDFLDMQLHHHTGYFNDLSGRYMIFGGFGNQRYSQEFRVYDIETDHWETVDFTGDKIPPRFFPGMGVNEEQTVAYIFSGIGNESGDQTIGRQYFKDLYKVDLVNKEITKVWESSWGEENRIPVRNMILSGETSFYALCYPQYISNTHLHLYRFSISNGNYEIVGDSIPIRSEKISTNANLYYNKKLKEFYCTIQEFKEDGGSSVIRVYSLADPPIAASELSIYTSGENSFYTYIIILIIGILIIGGVTIKIKSRKKERVAPQINPTLTEVSSESATPHTEKQKNAIYLFGKFTVYDKEGRDISYMFSNRLKQVLLVLLQHNQDNGISSKHLSEILWPDKPEQKVKNTRGVTLNHLRKALGELSGIELTHEKGYFKIVLTEECYCDYLKLQQVRNEEIDQEKQDKVIQILSRGKFLKSIEIDTLDSFKEKTESIILTLLPHYMVSTFKQGAYKTTLEITNIIFYTDPLHEEALQYFILASAKLKKEEEARKRYLLFTTAYKKEMGEEYPHSFQSLLKNKIL